MEELKVIKPKGLQFAYGFTKDECYKELTGVCSLDEPFNQTLSDKVRKKNRAEKNIANGSM